MDTISELDVDPFTTTFQSPEPMSSIVLEDTEHQEINGTGAGLSGELIASLPSTITYTPTEHSGKDEVQQSQSNKLSVHRMDNSVSTLVSSETQDKHDVDDDCQDGKSLLELYHPGVFTNGKWSCCNNNSKHSTGCQITHQTSEPLSPLVTSHPPTPPPLQGGGRAQRGPLPPTLIDKLCLQQPTSTREIQNHRGCGPNAPYSHEHHDPRTPLSGASSRSDSNPTLEPTPLPVPVKRRVPEPPRNEFEAIIVSDYPGLERGDLPLVKGEKVTVLDDSRDFWWRARDQQGREGFIPRSYVQTVGLDGEVREGFIPRNYVQTVGLDGEVWFFPPLSRRRAEDILEEEGKDGGFVVRNSSRENTYALSICHKGQVRHYLIKQDEFQRYFVSEKYSFPTIKDLIEYHKLNSGGMVTRLTRPPAQLVPNIPLFDEAWEIDRRELTLGKELDSGQFARVFAGKWRSSVDVAIKMMKEGSMSEDDFIKEAQIMKHFHHANLAKLFGVCTKQRPIFIVQEVLSNGCLLQYMRQHKHLAMNTDYVLDMARQICLAMKYLESNGFIHRDLAARNCLIGDRNYVKVTNYGLGRFFNDNKHMAPNGTKYSVRWAAPEVLTHTRFSSKSDVWSYGILLWELWTGGNNPYPTFTNSQVEDKVVMGYRLDKPKLCPPEIYTLMRQCWLKKSDDRPTFSTLFSLIASC